MSVFNGTWKIDLARSSKWDAATGTYVPDEVGEEIITLRIEDGVQDYEVLYGNDPVIRMGYTSRYDSPEWVPYAVREIIGRPGESQADAVAKFRARIGATEGPNARNFEVGRPYGLVRTVYVDERTHYRIGKAEDGSPQNVMLRRMAPDGQSYVATVLDAEGVVHRIRTFVRREA
ncbi:MAG: hypothetical protein U1E70_05920 [Acetobacteraceae bacterium]|nr:hypothetical protein [Pseudomonadota bacterium]